MTHQPCNIRAATARELDARSGQSVLGFDPRFEERPSLQSTDDVHSAAAAVIERILLEPTPFEFTALSPTHAIKIPFGTGKTHATAQAIVKATAQSLDTGDKRPILVVGPTHNLLAEIGRMIEHLADEAGVVVKVGHYFSMNADTKPDGEHTPCRRKNELLEHMGRGGRADALCGGCAHSGRHDDAGKPWHDLCRQHHGLNTLQGADVILMAGDASIFGKIPKAITDEAKRRVLDLPIAAFDSMGKEERKAHLHDAGWPPLFKRIVVDEFDPIGANESHSGRAAPKVKSLRSDLLKSAEHLADKDTVPATWSDTARMEAHQGVGYKANLVQLLDVLKAAHEAGREYLTPDDLLSAFWHCPHNSRETSARLIETKRWVEGLRLDVHPLPPSLTSGERGIAARALEGHHRTIQDCVRLLEAAIAITKRHEEAWLEAKEVGDPYEEGLLNAGEMKIEVPDGGTFEEGRVDVLSRRTPNDQFLMCPVLMLDATANHSLNAKLLRDYIVALDLDVEANEHVQHFHVHATSYPHSTLTAKPSNGGLLTGPQGDIVTLVWWAHTSRGGITLLIVPKAFANVLRRAPAGLMPPLLPLDMSDEEAKGKTGVVLMHFGDTRGRNGGKHATTHLQFGRPLLRRDVAERTAAVMHSGALGHEQAPVASMEGKDDDVDPNSKWPKAAHQFNTTDGLYWHAPVPDHSDQAVMEICHAVGLNEFEQAIGRSRGNRRTAENPLLIISGADVALRSPVTRPVSKYELAALCDPRFAPLIFDMYLPGKWAGGSDVLFGKERVTEGAPDALASRGPQAIADRPQLREMMRCKAVDKKDAFAKRGQRNESIADIVGALAALNPESPLTVEGATAKLHHMPVARALLNLEARLDYVPAGLKGGEMKNRCTVFAPGPWTDLMDTLKKALPDVEVTKMRKRPKKTRVEHADEELRAREAKDWADQRVKEVERSIYVTPTSEVQTGGQILPGVTCVGHAQDLILRRLNPVGPDGVREVRVLPRLTTDPTTIVEAVAAAREADTALRELQAL